MEKRVRLNQGSVLRRQDHPETYTPDALRKDAPLSAFIGTPKEIERFFEVQRRALEAVGSNDFELVKGPDDICRCYLNPDRRFCFDGKAYSVSQQEFRARVRDSLVRDERLADIERRRRGKRGSRKAFQELVNLIENHWQKVEESSWRQLPLPGEIPWLEKGIRAPLTDSEALPF